MLACPSGLSRFAMKHGKPLAKPGAEFHYADTGYILLGEILERRTGNSLATAYRTLLHFNKLGLADTYLETLEPKPARAKQRAHQYLGTIDAADFDPSFDLYGGGGLVSTVDDLGQLAHAAASLAVNTSRERALESGGKAAC